MLSDPGLGTSLMVLRRRRRRIQRRLVGIVVFTLVGGGFGIGSLVLPGGDGDQVPGVQVPGNGSVPGVDGSPEQQLQHLTDVLRDNGR